MKQTEINKKFAELIANSNHVVIIQADNVDADSLSSSLALEEILGDLGKKVSMYCGVDVPDYLKYLSGWDRISDRLPDNYDLAILVDVSNEILLEQLGITKQLATVKSKPCVLIDHHASESNMDWVKLALHYDAVSTTELIYDLAKQAGWPLNERACELIVVGILSDSLGLTTEAVTADTLRRLSELIEAGVSLPKLENARRSTTRRPAELVHYKGRLLDRIEYRDSDKIAVLHIPWEEIEKYSPLYNPSMLAIDDMRLATHTAVAICFKSYPDGRITAKIRSNWGFPIAAKLAEKFDGGGHPYAAGFRQLGKDYKEVKEETIKAASELLADIKEEQGNAVI